MKYPGGFFFSRALEIFRLIYVLQQYFLLGKLLICVASHRTKRGKKNNSKIYKMYFLLSSDVTVLLEFCSEISPWFEIHTYLYLFSKKIIKLSF